MKAFLQQGEVVDRNNVLAVSRDRVGENGEWNLSGDRYRENSEAVTRYPMVALAEVAGFFTDGNWVESKDQSDSGIRLIQTGNIGIGEYLDKPQNARFISEEKFDELNCTEVLPGDVLVSRLPDPVGRACLAPNLGIRQITAVDCSIIRFDPSRLLPELFVAFSKSDAYYRSIEGYLTGATRPRISRSNLGKIEIPLPPLEVQKEIVAEIEGYQKIIDGARQVVENYQPRIPIHPDWPMLELGEIAENLDSQRVPITKGDRKEGPYPYYGASGIVDYVDGYLFDEDLLLISEDGANLLARSTPIAFSVSGKVWVNNHAHVLRFPEMATQRFVEIYINSRSIAEYVTGAAQPKLNQKALNSIVIPLPDIEMQRAIVEELEEIGRMVEANRGLIQRFEEKIKQTISRVWGDAE